jgi:hypothetical protein
LESPFKLSSKLPTLKIRDLRCLAGQHKMPHAAESFAHQTQAESLYERFIGRTPNYKSLTKDSVQGWAGREDADGNGMKRIKEVKL